MEVGLGVCGIFQQNCCFTAQFNGEEMLLADEVSEQGIVSDHYHQDFYPPFEMIKTTDFQFVCFL